MTLNELNILVKSFINEYIQEQLGASGGNATDGNDITSPRPFPDDKSEIQNYINKNVYGAEGGHYRKDKYTGNYPNRDRRGGMFEVKNYIKKYIKEQAYGHATLTTQGPSRTRTRIPTDEYPFSALPKRTATGMMEQEEGPSYDEVWLKDKLGNPVKDVYKFDNNRGHIDIYPDLGNSQYIDRSSQFIRFKLEEGEVHFVHAFGYERGYDMLKSVLPELGPMGDSSYAGMMNVNTDYGTIPVDADIANKMIDALKGGLDAEATAQTDFYSSRGPTSGTIDEQLTPGEMDSYNKEKVGYQKKIAGVDVEIAEKNKEAISAQLQQQTSALGPQLDAIEKQLYDTNQIIKDKKGQRGVVRRNINRSQEAFDEIDPVDEEARLAALETLQGLESSLDAVEGEITQSTEQRKTISQQRDQILKQRSQAQSQASSQLKQANQAIRDQRKAMGQIGKEMQENLLNQYLKERKNTNLMEQMDSYKESTRGSLKKIFKMFEEGKTNEEVLRHYAKRGISIPETYIGKAKKQYESYEKLKLELGFMEQEAKDFKKPPVMENEPTENKQLASGLFKEYIKKELTKLKK